MASPLKLLDQFPPNTVAQLDVRPTGDLAVSDWTPVVGTTFFSPLLIQEGQLSFSVSEECAIATDKRGIHIIFFLFLHENICCGYSLEVPQ